MHRTVAEFARRLCGNQDEREHQCRLGRAYGVYVSKRGTLWSDQVEAIHHLHEAHLGDEACGFRPMAIAENGRWRSPKTPIVIAENGRW
jgi:hypothetical protein